ncbi:hypothetical protein DH2020_021152 [Rehmannia glutinosa]|uniref:GH16 domain-containing protein n=1 Tax=Rehmannia glutinosa TaxID=99300 RepID=A0ABR0W9L1_REHGL
MRCGGAETTTPRARDDATRHETLALAAGPPSPGYYPSSRIGSIGFNQGFRNLWGPQHQKLDQGALTIWLDRSSGSGFKSLNPYSSGYFGAAIKLQSGYTAGVITSLYLSNNEAHPGNHDEIDIEFLGTTQDKPYVLQTNVYIRGSGDGNLIGREMKFHLWFDPTKDFHNYAILWNPNEIIFFVDDVPIRRYPRKSDDTFPMRPMWVYGSIWDASSWATENGKYKADYNYQPFVGKYNNFKISGCNANGAPRAARFRFTIRLQRAEPPAVHVHGMGPEKLQGLRLLWGPTTQP